MLAVSALTRKQKQVELRKALTNGALRCCHLDKKSQMRKCFSFSVSCEPESYDECLNVPGKAKEGTVAPLLLNQPWNQTGEKCPLACYLIIILCISCFWPPQKATE